MLDGSQLRGTEVGIIVGTWHFGETQSDLPGAATGLRVEQREDGTLRIPKLGRLTFLVAGEELFDWAFNDHTVSVHAGIPAHPYLWENLDAVMRAAGRRRDTDVCVWQPNPAHARLRTRWDTLSPRDRFLLAMPSLWGGRPFDRLLS
jgi:hypothetical protein